MLLIQFVVHVFFLKVFASSYTKVTNELQLGSVSIFSVFFLVPDFSAGNVIPALLLVTLVLLPGISCLSGAMIPLVLVLSTAYLLDGILRCCFVWWF